MAYEIANTANCMLCGKHFTGPTATIIGKPGGRVEGYMRKLATHINKEHADKEAYITANGMQHMGVMYLSFFDTTDTELIHWRDFLRWQVHQATLNCRIPDENLKARTAELSAEVVAIVEAVTGPLDVDYVAIEQGTPNTFDDTTAKLKTAIAEKLFEYFAGMRDVLQEPNKYKVSNLVAPDGSQISPV